MLQVGVVAVFLAAAAIYAAPSITAAIKGHRHFTLVVTLNVLLGWTVVGWLLALLIALQISPRRPAWTKRARTPRAGKPITPRSQPEVAAARRDANDPPEVHEDAYAAWLDEGAGLQTGGQS